MKKKNKLVSLLLTLIMVLTAIPMNGIVAFAVSASDFTEPTIFVDSKYSAANSTVAVNIVIANNPGIAGATLMVAYDQLLTLTAAANGEAFSNLTFTKPGSFSNPSRFLWDSESGETKKDGTILTLTFEVSEAAQADENLNIEISSNLGDFYDEDMETVNLQLVNGNITVIDYIPGDVNSDGVVNGKDVTMARRQIVGGYNQTINDAAADVNEDGTLPTPTRVGFTFAGWYTAASGGSQVSASTKPTSATNVTIYAHWTCNSYTASWSTGTGYSITVNRTSSPNGGASTGAISSGTKVYYGDVLSITYTASTGYSISSKGATSITVSGNVTSSNIYATATANSYTYNVVYKSSNGTALGSTTVTKTFGTTNTISAPAKTGYTTPSSQSVKWDSTSKTITFSYTPISQSATQTIATGTWWTSSSGSSKITYKVEAQWRNRTATSIEIRVHWTNTITNSYNSGYYGYKQEFEWWGWHTIAAASAFSSPGGTRTSSCYSDWHTYTISPTDTTRNIGSTWKDNNGKSGNWSGTVKIPAY